MKYMIAMLLGGTMVSAAFLGGFVTAVVIAEAIKSERGNKTYAED